MPREMVHSEGPYHPEVGWSRDSYVQLGVATEDGRSLVWQLYGEPMTLERVGQSANALLRKVSSGSPSDPPVQLSDQDVGKLVLDALDTVEVFTSIWSGLDRQDCNRLIRLIRKARDQAFGADA